MLTSRQIAVSAVGLMVLSACGGGGGGDVTTDIPQGIPIGQTITTEAAIGTNPTGMDHDMRLAFGTVRVDNPDQITLNLDGEVYVLTRNDSLNGNFNPGDGADFPIFSFLDSDRYSGQFARIARLRLPALNGQASILVGNPTDPGNLPVNTTAMYVGGAVVYTTRDDRNFGVPTVGGADVSLEANFTNGTVSGVINDDGRILLIQQADILGNGFNTTLTSDAPNYALSESNVNGSFYGDAAQEVGGNFGYNYTDNSGADEVTGQVVGVFHAD